MFKALSRSYVCSNSETIATGNQDPPSEDQAWHLRENPMISKIFGDLNFPYYLQILKVNAEKSVNSLVEGVSKHEGEFNKYGWSEFFFNYLKTGGLWLWHMTFTLKGQHWNLFISFNCISSTYVFIGCYTQMLFPSHSPSLAKTSFHEQLSCPSTFLSIISDFFFFSRRMFTSHPVHFYFK